MNVEVLIRRFRQWYDYTDFRDNKFIRDEYNYKYDRGQEMLKWLGRGVLRQLIEEKKWDEVCTRVVDSFSMSSGPLARWSEYQWVRELDTGEKKQFVLALEEFLYGDEAFLERLEYFVAEATNAYLNFRNRDSDTKYKAKKLSWPFVSYFHFMMWPDQEYVFIKPMPLHKASEAADFDIHYNSYPNPDTYAHVQEFYHTLWPTVQKLGGRDWIDVQTLIHVAGGGFGTPEEGWIDKQIESDPWAERIASWRKEHLSQERVDARREAEQEARKLMESHLGHFDEQPLNRFLTLLNADFSNDQKNYTRFGQAFRGANRKLIVEHLEAFNSWSARLWQAPESDIYALLDEFWQRRELPGAGRSLPTMILYLRDPSRYNIWLPSLIRGLERLTGYVSEWNRSGADYRRYNQAVNEMRNLYDLKPQETDVILVLAQGVSEPLQKMPSLASIGAYVANSSYVFSEQILANYHLSLLTKPFVILTGLSGTGKTLLTRLYADAVYDIEEDEDNPYYAIVAVRPDWTDSRDLLGYYNPLTRTYEATPFLRFMLRAATDPGHRYYVCLDEMNLARVEYYFSDFLSALETGEPVDLHTHKGQGIATIAGDEADVPLKLPAEEIAPWGYVVEDVLYVPSRITIPDNLYISGTVNVDETTHTFSDKVLDRANSIEFSRVDLAAYERRYREDYPDRIDLLDEVMPLLRQLYQLLEPCYLHFGYRTLDEVLAYLWHNETLDESVRQPRAVALDNQVVQKILPKLRGDERIQEALEGLLEILTEALGEGSQSATKLHWMMEELKSFGSTQFWR
jgi:hypothetical protein